VKKLLVSIHDVGPRFEAEVDLLLDQLARHVETRDLAMLVVPDHWGTHPLQPGSAFAARLRGWSDAGVSMFAHGWFHKDMAVHPGATARFKARHMTAGEGEFLGLNEELAARRMADGRDLIESIIGRPVAGFVAPAWLYGRPALDALAASGFALAEDHMKIWHAPTGQVLARGPVITWASRSRARIASSLLVARLLPQLLRHMPVARVAVHPGDAHVPRLLESIDHVLRRLKQSHAPAPYGALLAA
jgi:predicted deacetylase